MDIVNFLFINVKAYFQRIELIGAKSQWKSFNLNTSSILEEGSAPVKEATKILVRVVPLGRITLSIMDRYLSPLELFARSKTSDKNVNIDLQASLYIEKKIYKKRQD